MMKLPQQPGVAGQIAGASGDRERVYPPVIVTRHDAAPAAL